MTPARKREAWVDVAKGAAILLVVLFHAGGYVPPTTTAGSAWELVNVVLVSVRMPLFFLVSGLFIGTALVSQPARRFLRRKPWPPLYLFVVWGLIFAGLHAVSGGAFGESAVDTLLLQTTLWYMAGLAVHMVLAWVIRGFRPAVQIGGAAVLAVPFAVFFPFELGGFAHIPNYFVFFLIGCHARPALTALVKRTGLLRAGVLLSTCVGLLGVAVVLRRFLPEVQELQAVILFALLPLVAVPFALICCNAIAHTHAGTQLSWLGRHTLPVFLIHPLALQLLDVLGGSVLGELAVVAWVMPLVLSVGALGLSVVVWHVLEMYAPALFGPTLHGSGRHGGRRRTTAPVVDVDDATPRLGLPRIPAPRLGLDATGPVFGPDTFPVPVRSAARRVPA